MPRTAIVFDIDGTLTCSSSAHLDALAAAAEHILDTPAVFTMRGETPLLNGEPVAGWVDAQCFRHLAESAGVAYTTVADALLADYECRYRAYVQSGAPVGTLLPGVGSMLDRLADAGVLLALSTGNAAGIAHMKLERLGIARHFDFDSTLGFGTAHPDRVTTAASAVEAVRAQGADRIYLVGDTLADMQAATTNGITGVGVCTGAATGGATRQLGSQRRPRGRT